MMTLMAIAVTLKWWMLIILVNIVMMVIAIITDEKQGKKRGMFEIPVYSMSMINVLAMLVIWLIYFIIN